MRLCIRVVMLAALAALASGCPPDWKPYTNGICYRWFEVGWPWYVAKDVCDFGYPGSQLASVHDPELNRFLAETVAGNNAAWLGLHRATTAANWTWTDGSPFNFSYWRSGYPGKNGEACGIFNCGEIGEWCTRDCRLIDYPLLCQIDGDLVASGDQQVQSE